MVKRTASLVIEYGETVHQSVDKPCGLNGLSMVKRYTFFLRDFLERYGETVHLFMVKRYTYIYISYI